MDNLRFITKKKVLPKTDVSITIVGKKEAVVSIIVRNGKEKQITKTGYVSVAVSGDRLYFKEETEELGYKLTSKASKTTFQTSIRDDDLVDYAITHSGDYYLMFDKKLKLFYIDAE